MKEVNYTELFDKKLNIVTGWYTKHDDFMRWKRNLFQEQCFGEVKPNSIDVIDLDRYFAGVPLDKRLELIRKTIKKIHIDDSPLVLLTTDTNIIEEISMVIKFNELDEKYRENTASRGLLGATVFYRVYDMIGGIPKIKADDVKVIDFVEETITYECLRDKHGDEEYPKYLERTIDNLGIHPMEMGKLHFSQADLAAREQKLMRVEVGGLVEHSMGKTK